MARLGRPTKLTEEVKEQIVELLSTGCSLDSAAEAVGITSRTLRSWRRAGEDVEARLAEGNYRPRVVERRYLKIVEATRARRAKAEIEALATIRRAARDGEWKAAAWYLERVHSEEYGARPRRAGVGGRPTGSASAPDRRDERPGLRVVAPWRPSDDAG